MESHFPTDEPHVVVAAPPHGSGLPEEVNPERVRAGLRTEGADRSATFTKSLACFLVAGLAVGACARTTDAPRGPQRSSAALASDAGESDAGGGQSPATPDAEAATSRGQDGAARKSRLARKLFFSSGLCAVLEDGSASCYIPRDGCAQTQCPPVDLPFRNVESVYYDSAAFCVLQADGRFVIHPEPVLPAAVLCRTDTLKSIRPRTIAFAGPFACMLDTAGAIRCLPTSYIDPPPPFARGSRLLSGAVDIAAGYLHACAVVGSGAVACWGYGESGALGDGTRVNRSAPVWVANITTARRVVAGGSSTCALLADATVRCWGDDTWGQVAPEGPEQVLTPRIVPGIRDAIDIIVGDGYACTLDRDGRVLCWGSGSKDGPARRSDDMPHTVDGLAPTRQIVTAGEIACALQRDGQTLCWGTDRSGGLPSVRNVRHPVAVPW